MDVKNLKVQHLDGTNGIVEKLDPRKFLYFKVKFEDGISSSQHAARLIHAGSTLFDFFNLQNCTEQIWQSMVIESVRLEKLNSKDKKLTFPFVGLDIKHIDRMPGVILKPDERRILHFIINFSDGVNASHHASKLTHNNQSLLTLIPDADLTFSDWRNLLANHKGSVKQENILSDKSLPEEHPQIKDETPPYVRVSLTQGTESWLNWRYDGIGASEAPAVMGEGRWKSRKSVLQIKVTRQDNFKGNRHTRLGTELESAAREAYQKKFKINVYPACIESTKYSFMRASLDGFSENGQNVVEIKCGEKIYQSVKQSGQVPDYLYGQLQHILVVTDLKFIDFWSYWIDSEPINIRVYRDEIYIKRLIEQEAKFWEEVKAEVKNIKLLKPPIETKITPEIDEYFAKSINKEGISKAKRKIKNFGGGEVVKSIPPPPGINIRATIYEMLLIIFIIGIFGIVLAILI